MFLNPDSVVHDERVFWLGFAGRGMMDEFVVNVEAAVVRDGECLLVERSAEEEHAAGMLSLVGGKVEVDAPTREVLEQTVAREVQEEVGLSVSDLRYVTSSAFVSDTGEAVVNVVFLARYAGGEARVLEPDEVSTIYWRSFEDAMALESLPPYVVNYLEAAEAVYETVDWE